MIGGDRLTREVVGVLRRNPVSRIQSSLIFDDELHKRHRTVNWYASLLAVLSPSAPPVVTFELPYSMTLYLPAYHGTCILSEPRTLAGRVSESLHGYLFSSLA